jgi:hypothetical protein
MYKVVQGVVKVEELLTEMDSDWDLIAFSEEHSVYTLVFKQKPGLFQWLKRLINNYITRI